MLVLSVPLVGAGPAAGAAAGRAAFAFTAVVLLAFTFRRVGAVAKLSIASETPITHARTPSKLRVLLKPELEEDCFFMAEVG